MPTSRATRVTSEMKPLSWSTMPLIVFLRTSISPWTSAETFLLRSPSATAPITRCISLLGRTRSSIRLLTDSMQSPQTWSVPLKETRWESLPSLPTTRLTRSSSVPERLVGADDLVQPVGDLALHAGPVDRHPGGEVAGLDLAQDLQQHLGLERREIRVRRRGHVILRQLELGTLDRSEGLAMPTCRATRGH